MDSTRSAVKHGKKAFHRIAPCADDAWILPDDGVFRSSSSVSGCSVPHRGITRNRVKLETPEGLPKNKVSADPGEG